MKPFTLREAGLSLLFATMLAACASSSKIEKVALMSSPYYQATSYMQGSKELRHISKMIYGPGTVNFEEVPLYISDSTVFLRLEDFVHLLFEVGFPKSIEGKQLTSPNGSLEDLELLVKEIDREQRANFLAQDIPLKGRARAGISLYFSNAYDNVLVAEVVLDPDHIRDYDLLTRQSTSGLKFLFVFDEHGDIIHVHKTLIVYS